MAGPIDFVIAGSKPFALTLFAPVTERAGGRPRIAAEPEAAVSLCAGSCDVLVVEYEPRWLPALTSLRRSRPGLRVVAALAHGQESAALVLGPLSIDAVPWDGTASSVLPAIERAIGGSRAVVPAPVAQPPAVEVPPARPPPPPQPRQAQLQAPRLPSSPPPPPPSPPPPPPPSGPRPPPSPPPVDLFKDLGGGAATPLPASLESVPARPAPAGPGGTTWPANGPGAEEAERALRGALAGAADPSPLGVVAGRAASALTALEREVFAGARLAVDAEVIRRAAVMRLRVAVALATRPARGTASDGVAVAGLLAEIDGLLASVKGLLDQATPQARISLEAIRNALVREAVDFSDACHEVGTIELALPPPPRRAGGRAERVRELPVRAGVEAGNRARAGRRWLVPLVVVLALVGAFLAWSAFR